MKQGGRLREVRNEFRACIVPIVSVRILSNSGVLQKSQPLKKSFWHNSSSSLGSGVFLQRERNGLLPGHSSPRRPSRRELLLTKRFTQIS